jgi:hypothetical protein
MNNKKETLAMSDEQNNQVASDSPVDHLTIQELFDVILKRCGGKAILAYVPATNGTQTLVCVTQLLKDQALMTIDQMAAMIESAEYKYCGRVTNTQFTTMNCFDTL